MYCFLHAIEIFFNNFMKQYKVLYVQGNILMHVIVRYPILCNKKSDFFNKPFEKKYTFTFKDVFA